MAAYLVRRAGLAALPDPAGDLPVVRWREGSLLATSVYDAEALAWAAPSYAPYPIW